MVSKNDKIKDVFYKRNAYAGDSMTKHDKSRFYWNSGTTTVQYTFNPSQCHANKF